MPSAVLEETGILGGLLVSWLLISLVGPVFTRSDFAIFILMSAALLVNFGEMVFFSVGGMGLYFWLLFGFCYMQATSTHYSHEQLHRHV